MTKIELAHRLEAQIQMVSDQIRQHWAEDNSYDSAIERLDDLLGELTGQLVAVNKLLIHEIS